MALVSRNASENPAGIETDAFNRVMDKITSRNASENPAGIETEDTDGHRQTYRGSRNASENPAGIETLQLRPSICIDHMGRNASENPAGIETYAAALRITTSGKSQRIRKPSRD